MEKQAPVPEQVLLVYFQPLPPLKASQLLASSGGKSAQTLFGGRVGFQETPQERRRKFVNLYLSLELDKSEVQDPPIKPTVCTPPGKFFFFFWGVRG